MKHCARSVAARPRSLAQGLHTALAAAAISLCGCGATIAVPFTVLISPAAKQKIASVTNFGDSITCGYYAGPDNGQGYIYSTGGYAGVLDSSIAMPAQNLCRPGDQAADMARWWVYPNAVPQLGAKQLYTVLIGTNDANSCGNSPSCLATWSQALLASLTWLALPAGDKVLGSAVRDKRGPWTSDLTMGLQAPGPGAVLTFSVRQQVAGRSLFVAYRVFNQSASLAGAAILSVDGIPVTTLSAAAASDDQPFHTPNGTEDTIFVAKLPLGSVGEHTITLTTTSKETAAFSFLWAGTATGDYAALAGAPRVLIGGVPVSLSPALQTTIDIYNGMLGEMISDLAHEGLNITLASSATALNPASDLSDIVHPNAQGHRKLAQVFAGPL